VNREEYLERAEIIRDKGTNRGRFLRGEVDKYTWVDLGSSYVISDLLAAFLFAQLEQHVEIQQTRRNIWNRYAESLKDWAASARVQLPYVPNDCDSAYHMFYMLMPSFAYRQALIQHLSDHGILSVFHYVPLHRSPMAAQLKITGDCPVTDSVSERLIRLPFFNSLTEEEQTRIVQTILQFS
jgi:dTDP-4-amino-4,6-dideoxygalactose transaminase